MRSTVSLLFTIALVAASCGGTDATSDHGGPRIVATTSIWADVVANVACGDEVVIETVIPVGADAHAFEPSLADRARFEDADLIVTNGLDLEEGLEDTIDAAESSGTPVLALGHAVDAIAYSAGGAHDHGDDADHDHESESDDDHGDTGGDDPHFWFDPDRVALVIPTLAEHLIEAGLDRDTVEGCADAYVDELVAADAEIGDLVAGLPVEQRLLVTNHDTLGYFADRYGFEVVGTVSQASSGMAETSVAHLVELAEQMESTGVRVVFTDAATSSDDATALADRVDGAEVVELLTESLGQPGSPAETYLGFLSVNATAIVSALS